MSKSQTSSSLSSSFHQAREEKELEEEAKRAKVAGSRGAPSGVWTGRGGAAAGASRAGGAGPERSRRGEARPCPALVSGGRGPPRTGAVVTSEAWLGPASERKHVVGFRRDP